MNKYLVKIAASTAKELAVAKSAGKAILGDTIGSVAGAVGGGYAGSKFDNPNSEDPHKYQHRGALFGGAAAGTGLMYHSLRSDMLKKLAGFLDGILSPPVQTPITSETATRTIGTRG